MNFDDAERLQRILQAAQRLVEADQTLDVRGGKVAKLHPDSDWPPLACNFATYSFDVWANRIVFTCEQVDLELAITMHKLGQAGDLSLVQPDAVGIFAEASTQTIPDLWQQKMNVKQLTSPKDVLALLKKSHKEQQQGRSAKARKRFGDRYCEMPGLWPQRAPAHFIELANDEGPLALYEAVEAFDRVWHKSNPEAGRAAISCSSWILETPDGHRFGAITWAGQLALAMLKDFAKDRDRRDGYASNFSTLIVCDGSSYKIADCRWRESDG